MADEKILARVRKLLDRAAHPNTPEAEAQSATERAQALMAKHQIDEALAQSSTIDRDDVETIDIAVDAPYAKEKSSLLNVVAQHFQCRAASTARKATLGKSYVVVRDPNGNPIKNPDGTQKKRRKVITQWRYGVDVTVWGFRSDLKLVEMLYTSLVLQAIRDMKRSRPMPGEDTASHMSSWLIGFINSVRARLRAARRRAEAEQPGTGAELVLADRKALVEAAFAAANDEMTSSTIKARGTGYRAGWDSGQSADLGAKRMDGGRTSLPR